jgi:hypothetical protein
MRTRKKVLANERLLTAPRRIFGLSITLNVTCDRALQPGCDAEPRFGGVRCSAGGLQPTLAVRRLSSSTTPGVERDAPSMRAWRQAGITSDAHSAAMVNERAREDV